MIIHFIFISFLKFTIAENVEIDCSNTIYQKWPIVGTVMVCYIENVKISEKDSIVADGPMANTEVTAIQIWFSPKILYFPHGLKKKFPNVKAISLVHLEITSLDEHDLEEFGSNLKFLKILRGNLTHLSPDLFKYNRNIEYVAIEETPLKILGHEFHQFVAKTMQIGALKRIDLKGCLCFDEKLERKDFDEVKWNQANCNKINDLIEIKQQRPSESQDALTSDFLYTELEKFEKNDDTTKHDLYSELLFKYENLQSKYNNLLKAVDFLNKKDN